MATPKPRWAAQLRQEMSLEQGDEHLRGMAERIACRVPDACHGGHPAAAGCGSAGRSVVLSAWP